MKNKIALIGEILVDLVCENGDGDALAFIPCPGGSVFNTAATIHKLGCDTLFISKIGNDYWGNYLTGYMQAHNMDLSGIDIIHSHKTSLAFAVIDENGDAAYDFYKLPSKTAIKPIDFDDVSFFHMASYYSIVPDNRAAILAYLSKSKETNTIIVYDPNYRSLHADYKDDIAVNLKAAHIIKASLDDMQALFGVNDLDAAFKVLKSYAPVLTIITLGADGAAYSLGDTPYTIIKAKKDITVVDTIGAGDNFSAGLLYYLNTHEINSVPALEKARDEVLTQALVFANNTAAEAVSVRGASLDKERLDTLKASLS